MEAAALYYLAAQHHADALAIMTILIVRSIQMKTLPEERQTTFTDMMKAGLETLIAEARADAKVSYSLAIPAMTMPAP